MGLSPEELSSVLGRAKTLCNMDNQMNEVAAAKREQINGSLGGPSVSAYDADAAKWDAMFSDSAIEDYGGTTVPTVGPISESAFAKSKLPDAIKKSMMEKQITPQSHSVLSSMGIVSEQANVKPRTPVTETKQQQQYVPQGGSVDYSIIKAIVSECIREYFSNNQILAENSLKSIGLDKGVISLVDNKGNVFKAKLEKIGNVNENKE